MNYFCLFSVVQGACQRFALVVCGRAGKMLESRKKPKPEKMFIEAAESHKSTARFVGTLLT